MTHPAMTHRSQTPRPADSPQTRPQTPTVGAPATQAQTLQPTGPEDPERRSPRSAGRPTPARLLLDVVRGGLIGAVETVPGVSGGTVALVVGLYESLIGSLGHLVSAARCALLGLLSRGAGAVEHRRQARVHLRQVAWPMLLAVGLGMALAVVVMAGVMGRLVEDHPVLTSAAFFGMVLACTAVPAARVGRWRARDVLAAAAGAVATWAVVSLPRQGEADPAPWVIVLAAAVAICALVLPGLSGSFLLLTFGMYQPTLAAVNQRDLGYLTLFALGALLGLATVVKGLEWLLAHRHRVTLAVLTGVMIGGLRGLWPWQSETGALQPVGEAAGAALLVGVLGFLVVAAAVVLERRLAATRAARDDDAATRGAAADG
ncbi:MULTISPECIES: DUF368 domain-containing protein [Rothia]|nr:DUF368 domain-containing protein [Rothia kristinae]MCA1170389.1 DUF368 domain-containing protein [Rothia kristinae]MCT2038407.1 DUF368 domain-containing protein [Rothia kristinae]MCT2242887.1 DUF368 domain-containing protein [Rothia kristinae]MCT2365560.1 DUF368 domain-containing protein [Rothia kristinae]